MAIRTVYLATIKNDCVVIIVKKSSLPNYEALYIMKMNGMSYALCPFFVNPMRFSKRINVGRKSNVPKIHGCQNITMQRGSNIR